MQVSGPCTSTIAMNVKEEGERSPKCKRKQAINSAGYYYHMQNAGVSSAPRLTLRFCLENRNCSCIIAKKEGEQQV